jgi:hypothetical protein
MIAKYSQDQKVEQVTYGTEPRDNYSSEFFWPHSEQIVQLLNLFHFHEIIGHSV